MAKNFFALVSFYDYYERRKKGEIKNSSKNMKVWCFYNTNEFIFPQPPPNFHPFIQCHDSDIDFFYDVVRNLKNKI